MASTPRCPVVACSAAPRSPAPRRCSGRRSSPRPLRRRPRPTRSWSCCRCAARPTGCPWSSRTRTPSTTRPGRRSPYPPSGCSPGTARSACTRSSPRCCRSGTPAGSPRCTAPGCPRRTAPTSPRWRSWRTPIPARRPGGGWLNRLIGADGQESPLQGFNLGGGVLPTSLYGDDPVLSATDVSSVGIAGDDEWDPKDLRRKSLHTLWDPTTGPLGRAMRSMFNAVDGFAPVKETADQPEQVPAGRPGCGDGVRRPRRARQRRGDGRDRRPRRLGHALRPRHPGVGRDAEQRRGARRRGRGVLHRPRRPGRQGDAGGAERVRPAGRRRTRTTGSTTATAT